jgi:hypothetical protein
VRLTSGTPARTRLTGQVALAVAAYPANAASSTPGTRPTVTRSILVIVGAPSTMRIVSPAVNVPLPVGTSPFRSALPLAGLAASSPVSARVTHGG